MRCTISIILFFTLFFTNTLYAQQPASAKASSGAIGSGRWLSAGKPDEKKFTFYSIKDGLTNNSITSVTQDAYGYIWISTAKGLNRFDGNSFLQFYADSSRHSLPQDEIRKLKWLDKESLAAATYGGLHIINTRTLQSRNIIIPAGELKYPYRVNGVADMLGDSSGNIFILTGSGFYQYNNKDELVFRYDHFKKDGADTVTYQFGRNMILLRHNIILLSTIAGLYVYDGAKKEIHPAAAHNDGLYKAIGGPVNRFFFMHRDEHSFSVMEEVTKEFSFFNIHTNAKRLVAVPFRPAGIFNWRSKIFRLSDSVYAVNGKEKGFYLIKYNRQTDSCFIEPKLYFENYFCPSICMDKEGRLWVGTSQGLFREKRKAGNIERVTVPDAMNPFGKDLQIRMITMANDKLFAATNKQGLIVFDRSSMAAIKQIDLSGDWPLANNVFSAITTAADTLMAGTSGMLIWLNTRNYTHGIVNLPGWVPDRYWLPSLYKDSYNNLYACRATSDVFYYRNSGAKNFTAQNHKDNKLFRIVRPRCLAEDPEGYIWFGGEGISRYNKKLQQFDRLLDSFPFYRNMQKQVHCLAFDKKGRMYFGLLDNGLIIYDPVQKKFEQLTRSDGLPDNMIQAVYVHKEKIWMGTESGLASYDVVTKKISSFGIADDMPAEPFSAYTFYYDSARHQLYGAFANTLVRFNPDSLSKNNAPPVFFIESIVAEGDEKFFHPEQEIKLSYRYNNLLVNLAAVNFEDAYQQQFAYRFIKNGNESWQQTGSQRSIIFSNLSPGHHRLQVKVFIKNNSWPEQVKEILIYIKPPFWQTTWFLLMAGVLILSALYALYRYRIKGIRQKANIDRQMAELEIKGLHAQMNPHFIFNSLNSIKEMILEDEKQNASRYLSKFAQLIRTNLDQSRQTFITVKQCIEHLHQYLEMEKIRFEQFSYNIEADEDLPDDIRMVPMLIQPLVENAIWHGLRDVPGEKKLSIRFYKSQQQLVCEIEDNGIGINQSVKDKTGLQPTHRSLGITSIHERLKVLNEKYNMNSSLEIIDKSELPEKNSSGTLAVLRFNI